MWYSAVRWSSFAVFTAFLGLLSFSYSAVSAPAPRDALTHDLKTSLAKSLYRQTYLSEQFQFYFKDKQDKLSQGLTDYYRETMGAKANDEELERLLQALDRKIRDKITLERYEQAIVASLTSHLSLKELETLHRWMAEPMAEAMAKEQQHIMSEAGQVEMGAFYQQLSRIPLDKHRVEQVQIVVQTLHLDDLQAQFLTDDILSNIRMINEALPASFDQMKIPSPPRQELLSHFRRQVHNMNIAATLFLLRKLSEDDVDRYILLLRQSDAMTRYHEAVSKAILGLSRNQ
ncbi:hypothetical protein [Kistimonas asteriae]|uniref:hypothetical protein n=1 Tax=Kistimonas asteriae TaxID=517724 RepID=UPI001BAC187A|nr:hypothetical protein [Kistimonas asteriae]